MSNYYQAYGLNFESDLEFPELPVWLPDGDAAVDVRVRFGDVPDELANPASEGVLYQASANNFLLNLKQIARYLVRNGDEIVVQPVAGASLNDVRVFMLGSAFGALLHQRQWLVMHAGAIKSDHGAVLFSGPSGIGKSTLLGEMLSRGYKMMVDDVCAVVLDDNKKPLVLPGYPRTRLWADSAAKLEIDTQGLQRTRPSLEKFERQLPDQFHNEAAPMHRIYLLTSNNKDELELEPMPAISTFSTILHNTYRDTFLDGLEMRQPHFDMVTAVASNVAVTRVTRPSGSFRLDDLANLIEADLTAA